MYLVTIDKVVRCRQLYGPVEVGRYRWKFIALLVAIRYIVADGYRGATITPIIHKESEMAQAQTKAAPYWLIERGSPAEWFVGMAGICTDHWTRDASRAQRFSKWGAMTHAKDLAAWGVIGDLHATEHIDCDGPDLQQADESHLKRAEPWGRLYTVASRLCAYSAQRGY